MHRFPVSPLVRGGAKSFLIHYCTGPRIRHKFLVALPADCRGRLTLVLLLVMLVIGEWAPAATIIWDVHPGFSNLSLTIPDQEFPGFGVVQVRNEVGASATWDVGNKAAVDGTLVTDYTGTSIQLVAGGALFGVNAGNYLPNPAKFDTAAINPANPFGQFTSTTPRFPAVYAGRIRGSLPPIALDAAYFSIDSVSYELTSPVIPLTPLNPSSPTSFIAPSLNLLATGNVNYDGLVVPLLGQLLPDFIYTGMSVYAGTSNPSNVIVTPMGGGEYWMTIPIHLDVTFFASEDFALTGEVIGAITAVAIVPEPSTSVLAGCGAISLIAAAARRWPRQRRGERGERGAPIN